MVLVIQKKEGGTMVMKKNIWIVFCLLFVSLNTITNASSQDDPSPSTYLDTLNQSIMRPGMDVIRGWMDQAKSAPGAYIDSNIARVLTERQAASAATQLSLLNHLQYVPSERNQGSCGNCWNWAGQGVLGIALDVNKSIKDRLSTQFLNSCKTDRYACCGGWLDDFANWYAAQKITVPWANTNAAWADGTSQCQNNSSSVQCSALETNLNYEITRIEATTIDITGGQSQAISNIKNVLAQNKAIWFGFFLPNQEDWDQFLSFWQNQSEGDVWSFDFSQGHQWTNNGGGHAVLLVGYNEDATEPYWIVLNSWGTPSGRPNGLFHMKMNMKYDLFHYDGSREEQGLYFQTLNVQFGGGTPGECTYSVYPTNETFDANGGNGSMAVSTSSSSCAWAVTKTVDWITNISLMSGNGDAKINYTVSPNSGTQKRQGSLSVQGRTLTITQRGKITESNLLQNPGFEDGLSNYAWTQSGYYELIYRSPCFSMGSAECAHGGEWDAWLGGYDYAYDILSQTVTIPSSALSATLKFWYAIDTWDYVDAAYDVLYVAVYNGQWYTVYQLSNMNWTDDWVQSASIDLSAFIGQTVTIAFLAVLDGNSSTDFYIDDMELLCGTGFQPTLPVPDIKANGSDGPLTVSNTTPVSITIGINTGSFYGHNADWWIAASTPLGGFSYFDLYTGMMLPGLLPTYSGPLFNLGTMQLLTAYGLTAGTHTFYFAVDLNMNGVLDMDAIYFDAVSIRVTGQ